MTDYRKDASHFFFIKARIPKASKRVGLACFYQLRGQDGESRGHRYHHLCGYYC